MTYDVIIVGGGPGGLSAALALGRARRRVLLCDAGPRRNAAATEIHNFVTRDGVSPNDFRQVARQQLEAYPSVDLRDARVEGVSGAKGAFRVVVGSQAVEARRILLATGMIDAMLPIEGFQQAWGHAIFQCPYCHGWEVRDRPWGYLAREPEGLHFPEMLTNWTQDVTVFTNAELEIPAETMARYRAAAIRVETERIERLVVSGSELEGVKLESGKSVPCQILYAHPPQRQVELVAALGVATDEQGLVTVDPMTRETSVPGIYAAGDLTTRMQAAVAAAATGMQAAAMLTHELTAARVSAAL